MNTPLWKPTEKKVQDSVLKNFTRFINFESNKNFKDLWQWSVDNPELFWSKFWDYSKIIGDKGKEVIKKDKIFNKTKFFPDSRINYSENILKKRNSDIAINFLSESGFEENITWKLLYEKVCKFSSYLKSLDLKKGGREQLGWLGRAQSRRTKQLEQFGVVVDALGFKCSKMKCS